MTTIAARISQVSPERLRLNSGRVAREATGDGVRKADLGLSARTARIASPSDAHPAAGRSDRGGGELTEPGHQQRSGLERDGR